MNTENKITMTDLIGVQTVKAKRISASLARIPGQEQKMPCLEVEILEGQFQGTSAKYGVITQQVADKLLSTAERTADGTIYLRVPAPDPSKPINWINVL